jgi:hypothetical protein
MDRHKPNGSTLGGQPLKALHVTGTSERVGVHFVTETLRTVFVSTLTHPDQWTHPQLTVRSADIARLMYCMEMFQWLKQLWRSLTQKKAPPSAEALIVPELLPTFWTRGQRSNNGLYLLILCTAVTPWWSARCWIAGASQLLMDFSLVGTLVVSSLWSDLRGHARLQVALVEAQKPGNLSSSSQKSRSSMK